MSSWTRKQLADVTEVITKGTTPTSIGHEYTTSGVRFVKVESVADGGIAHSRCAFISPSAHVALARSQLRAGDVLFSIAGTLGRTGIVRTEDLPANTNQALAIIRPTSEVLPEFVGWFLRSPEVVSQVGQSGRGVGLQNLNLKQVSDLQLPVPPLDVQRRIVAKLDALLAQSRAAREQLEAVPALVEQYRQSVLAAAFRGDLTADWRKKNPDVEPASKLLERIRIERRQKWEAAELAKLKAKGKSPKDDKWKSKYVEPEPVDTSDLPELPPTWCWASIDELNVGDRSSAYGVLKPGPHVAGGVRLVKSGQVQEGTFDLDEDFRISADLSAEFTRTVLRGGEVLLNIVGSIGRSAVVPAALVGANVTRAIAVLPLRTELAEWAQTWLMGPVARNKMESESGGTAQPVLNLEVVRRLPVALAPTPEQAIVAKMARNQLATVMALANVAPTTILDDLERSLLAKAFRGELVT